MQAPHRAKITRSTTAQSRGDIAKRKSKFPAYVLADSAARQFLAKRPPSGVKVAFLPYSDAAEKNLRKWTMRWGTKKIPRPDKLIVDPKSAKPTKQAKMQAKIESSAYAPNSRARALLKGVEIAKADLNEANGTFDLEEVRKLLHGVSRQALEKRVREGSLLAVPGPSNRRRYPAVQFTRDGVVPGLKQVQAALPTDNPWVVLNFLVRPDERLGGRKPIEVLGKGDVDLVVSAARGMGVQGG